MKEIIDFVDQLIEIEKTRDIAYKEFCHSVHKDSKAIGESPMITYLGTLKEMLENHLSPNDMAVGVKNWKN